MIIRLPQGVAFFCMYLWGCFCGFQVFRGCGGVTVVGLTVYESSGLPQGLRFCRREVGGSVKMSR